MTGEPDNKLWLGLPLEVLRSADHCCGLRGPTGVWAGPHTRPYLQHLRSIRLWLLSTASPCHGLCLTARLLPVPLASMVSSCGGCLTAARPDALPLCCQQAEQIRQAVQEYESNEVWQSELGPDGNPTVLFGEHD